MPKKPRNYKNEYQSYHSSPEQKKNRAARNGARRTLMADGRVAKGDGKDVDHKVPLVKGGSTEKSNLRVKSASANRSFKRTKKAGMA